MRGGAVLLLLVACTEEKAVSNADSAVILEERVAPLDAPPTASVAGSTVTEVLRPSSAAPMAARTKAAAVRSSVLARRKQLTDQVRALESRIAQLENTLKVTGPRNDQRDVLTELGLSRGKLARLSSVRARCDRAFEGEEWSEVEATWLVAEDLLYEERDAAEENYLRFMELAADFRVHCQPLEPVEGAR